MDVDGDGSVFCHAFATASARRAIWRLAAAIRRGEDRRSEARAILAAMARAASRFKLQPADPFDLIRWLARSQSDARKAVAELVQNSIDARAKTIRIERRRLRNAPALVIWDDGEGVLPALGREEA